MIVILFDSARDVIYCTSCTNVDEAKTTCENWIAENSDNWQFASDWEDRFYKEQYNYGERLVSFDDPDGLTHYTFEIYRAD